MKQLFATIVSLALALTVQAQSAESLCSRTAARVFTGKDGHALLYRVAEKAPEDNSKIPLVLFLHGAGERGANNVSQLKHGSGTIAGLRLTPIKKF